MLSLVTDNNPHRKGGDRNFFMIDRAGIELATPGSAVRHVNHNAFWPGQGLEDGVHTMLFHSYIILFLLPSENAYESCLINLVLKFNKLLPSNCSSLWPSSCLAKFLWSKCYAM